MNGANESVADATSPGVPDPSTEATNVLAASDVTAGDVSSTEEVTSSPAAREHNVAPDERVVVSDGFEAWAWIAIVVAGAVLRFVGLDALPLDPSEAALAVAALAGEGVLASPLLQHLGSLALAVFGASETTARLVPALAGAALAPAAWGLRRTIGRDEALGVAVVLALSPIWIASSRHLDPLTLGVLLLLVAVGALTHGRPILAAACFGLAVATGSYVWPLLVGGVALAALGRVIPRRAPTSDHAAARFDARTLIGLGPGAAFAAALVLGATGLSSLSGLAFVATDPVHWIRDLAAQRIDISIGTLLPLLVYAPELLLFGAAGLLAPWKSPAWRSFALLALTIGALLAILAPSPQAAAVLLVPLTLAGGVALASLARSVVGGFRWSEDGVMTWILLIVFGYALIHAWRFARLGPVDGQRDDFALFLGAMAMAAVLLLAFALLWGAPMAVRVAGLACGVAVFGLAAANGARLMRTAGPEVWRPERGVQGSQAILEVVAAQRNRAPGTSIAVDPVLQPELAWLLREATDIAWTPSSAAEMDLWVLPSGVSPEGEGHVMVVEHDVSAAWRPTFMGRQGFMRWYLQRATVGDASFRPISPERMKRAALWVRAPLALDRGAPQTQASILVEGWR